jgi:hypothetical protein
MYEFQSMALRRRLWSTRVAIAMQVFHKPTNQIKWTPVTSHLLQDCFSFAVQLSHGSPLLFRAQRLNSFAVLCHGFHTTWGQTAQWTRLRGAFPSSMPIKPCNSIFAIICQGYLILNNQWELLVESDVIGVHFGIVLKLITACMTTRLPAWLPACLHDWLPAFLTDWLTACLHDCLSACMTDWLTDWLPACLSTWLSDWLTVCLHDWLTDRLPVYMTDWLTGWLTACPPACLPAYVTDWLADCMSAWLTG